ncbi:short chain dehydrogenase [Bacillus sp. SIMBA_008]|uniref:short chain dehydrogenase n=1 Tax=Bacillus TaxID=1386 RepID=UPI0011998CA1|nr:short chain dehydrogenase [Bacillus subtilis]TWH29414.1 NAD(P)-dependent dehydrogenase (short-subunit alcohol dehydrogenase family) [Bacillus subtilis J22]
MKLLLVGANGTIGSAVYKELSNDVEIITASRTNSDVEVDITSPASISKMFEQVGQVDAVASAAGAAHFGYVKEMTPEQNQIAVNSKLLGQINLVLLGLKYIRDNGSITLTTGILMDDPIVKAASAAMANGGIRAFVQSAAIEMPRGIRINHVSPSMLEDSIEKYGLLFQGFEPVASKRVGLAFRKSILWAQTGQSYNIY